MATPFESFVNAELPARIVIIRGATDATGDPNVSTAPLVNAAPAGSFYQQDDTAPKTLWVKNDAGATDWVELGSAAGAAAGFISVETSAANLQTNFPAADNDGSFAIVRNASPDVTDGIYKSNGTVWEIVLEDTDADVAAVSADVIKLQNENIGFSTWTEDPGNIGNSLYPYPIDSIVKFGPLLYLNETGAVISAGTTDPSVNADWSELSLGGGGLAATELDNWELDLGAQPIGVIVGNFTADQLNGFLDTALYTEETLGISYDPSKVIKFQYVYSMDGTATDQVDVSVGYDFIEKGTPQAPSSGYTEVADSFAGPGDTDIRTRTVDIPVQAGITTDRPILSLRFQRLGDSDANNDNFNLISIIIYQE